MLTALTLTSTWFANQQVKEILLNEGLEHTESLARNSTLALLYSSPENANSIIQSTMSSTGVEALAIYDKDMNRFIFSGSEITPITLKTPPIKTKKASIIKENNNHWHILAPVQLKDKNDEMERQLFKEEEQQETIGYAYIILNKSTLDDIKKGILLNNLIIALAIYISLLIILHFIIRRLTEPLEYISSVMKKTAKGQFTTPVNTHGPAEVQQIAETYNRMIEAISERDNELRMHNIQLEKKAIHDHLTGLTNRIGFEESLSLAIDECKNSNNQHVLCYMDLDKFKTINDTCGHSAGDELLIEISSLFKDKIRSKSDTLARIGGDEFALILKDCSVDKATIIAQLICDSVKDYRFNWDGKQYSIGVSIGIIPLDSSSASLKDVITKADVACYAAKEKGRGQVQVITIDDNESGKTTRRANITSLIEEAIKNDKFELFCQAISPLKNQRNIESNCEISLRLLDPDGDYYESSSIIESAKRHNLATDIDKWVIENTFRLLSNNNPLLNSINICTINLSEHSIITNEFSAFINERINHYHIDPKRICFEIAESSTIGILRKVKQFIDEIHALGCFFSLDNFDCGSLSLEYLRHMNVDFLKVEGVLLKKSTTDKISLSIIKAINEIAHSLNMMTIASSVETNDVLENINKLDFDFVQGHIIDKPALLWKSGF